MKVTVIFLLLQVISGPAWGQMKEYRFSRINVDNGLSNNQIKTVLKDHQGFLWIGTIAGLNRYDGYNIKVFTNHPGDSTSLISSDINKLFEGPDGKIWIHTWSGVNVYNPVTESFDRNTDRILHRLSIPAGRINDIKKDRNGNFWFIHATGGLFRYTEDSRETVALVHKTNDTTSISTDAIASWGEDPLGNIWVLHTNSV